jgi:outer membrane protein OmpA-like peptidoglycan-associated protein
MAGNVIAAVRADLVSLQGQMSGRNVTLSTVRQAWTQDVASYRVNKNQVLRPPPGGDVRTALSQGEAALKRLAQHTAKLTKEVDGFAQGSAEAGVLMAKLENVRPENDTDRAQLNVLRTEIIQTSTGLDSLVSSLTAETAQANAFLAKERASLAALGQGATASAAASPAARATDAAAPSAPAAQPIAAAQGAPKPAATRPAFVTIKFDRPSVTYREALAAALKQALNRRPDAAFDVVGVTPAQGAESLELVKARAEDVARTMMELNVPASRIGIDSMRVKSAASDEVRIFVR